MKILLCQCAGAFERERTLRQVANRGHARHVGHDGLARDAAATGIVGIANGDVELLPYIQQISHLSGSEHQIVHRQRPRLSAWYALFPFLLRAARSLYDVAVGADVLAPHLCAGQCRAALTQYHD